MADQPDRRQPAEGGLRLHPRLLIAGAWTSLMFCYLYDDEFGFYRPGKLAAMSAGRTPLGPTTQQVLLAFSVMMSIPALMIFLTLILPRPVSRGLNLVLGLFYAAIVVATMIHGWQFDLYFLVLDVALSAAIVVLALRWPKAFA